MTALVFLLVLLAILAVILAVESGSDAPSPRQQIGLLTWLSRGNWPTKVGGALIAVGVGALLRYATLNLDIPPPFKLATGTLMAAGLALASVMLPAAAARRSVALALAGSAFGVAYLTAYSAFALFGYLDNPQGLALLAVTSAAAGAYAIMRGALSLALLSMAGAFLAPAFAVTDPGAAIVYGYYAGASVLTLILVMMRGWHPLIHLSFLFTLAGGVFFAWTSRYYTGADAGVMLPMVLLLSAIHVSMPILERSAPHARWASRADLIFTLALPSVTALLVVLLAQNRSELATALIALGVVWAAAAGGYLIARKEGAAAHGAIAALLLVLGAATLFRNLPWALIGLASSVGSLAVAAMVRRPADRLHSLLAGLVLVFGALHILTSTAPQSDGAPFLHATFVERIIGAMLLVAAGVICRRIRQSLDTLLLVSGFAWAFVALGIEALRFDLATFALLTHWAAVLLAVSLWVPGRKLRGIDRNAGLLASAIALSAVWAVGGRVELTIAWASLSAAVLALVGLAVRPTSTAEETSDPRLVAALLAPATAAVWATKAGALAGIEHPQFGLCVAALVALCTLVAGARLRDRRGDWFDVAADVGAGAFSVVLFFATVFNIARNPWAVSLEVLCLAGLGFIAWIRVVQRRTTGVLPVVAVVGTALVVQAHLLRLLGPPGDLDIGDLLRLRFTALVSLLWTIVGSAFAIWSRRTSSRMLWFSGTCLLVAAAVKLLLVDFGSLGQIANILAVIAAGAVFLVVGWLVPIPPSAANPAPTDAMVAEPHNDVEAGSLSGAQSESHRKTAWTVTVALMLLGMAFASNGVLVDTWREWYTGVFSMDHVDRTRFVTADVPSGDPSASGRSVNSPTSATSAPTDSLSGRIDGNEPFDPARGVIGLRWGTPMEDVRSAYPPDERFVGDRARLWYLGRIRVDAMTLPKAVVTFSFDSNRLAGAVVVTGAEDGPALARILEARLGRARYGRQLSQNLHHHVFEWSTAGYGVRLQYWSNSESWEMPGRPVDRAEIEFLPSKLSTSLVAPIERERIAAAAALMNAGSQNP